MFPPSAHSGIPPSPQTGLRLDLPRIVPSAQTGLFPSAHGGFSVPSAQAGLFPSWQGGFSVPSAQLGLLPSSHLFLLRLPPPPPLCAELKTAMQARRKRTLILGF